MERLHSLIISMAGFDGSEPVGHLVVIGRENGATTETLELALEGPRPLPATDLRQWAKQVLAQALADL